LNIDTGCVFGDKLSALRYPKKKLFRCQLQKNILQRTNQTIPQPMRQQSAQQEFDDLLDIEIING
jgi:hypothetical protein